MNIHSLITAVLIVLALNQFRFDISLLQFYRTSIQIGTRKDVRGQKSEVFADLPGHVQRAEMEED